MMAKRLNVLAGLLLLAIGLVACGDNAITPTGSIKSGGTTYQAQYFRVNVPDGWTTQKPAQVIPSFQIPYADSLETVIISDPALQTQYTVRYLNNSYASLKATFDRQPQTTSGALQAGGLSGVYSITKGKHPSLVIKTPFTIGQCLLPAAGDPAHAYDLEYQEPLEKQTDQDLTEFQQFCQSLVPAVISK